MPVLSFAQWYKFVMKKVYVSEGETKTGWFDAGTRKTVPESEEYREALSAAALEWVAPVTQARTKPKPSSKAIDADPSATPKPAAIRPDRDLSFNAAGGHTQAKADELLAEKGWWERTADKY